MFDINDAVDCNNWFENSIQPIFVMKSVGQKLSLYKINKSACELLKCSPDNYQSLSPASIGLFCDESDMQKYIDAEIGPQGVSYLTHIKPLIEPTISSEITLYKRETADGDYLVAFQQSIGDSSKMLGALRHSEYRFLQMAENISDGIIIYENSKMVFVNSAFLNITSYTKEQVRDMDDG